MPSGQRKVALGRNRPDLPALGPRSGTEEVSLSFEQEREWVLHQFVHEGPNNLMIASSLRGSLDHEALRRSLEAIIHRHEALRTVFRQADGTIVQRVLPRSRHELPIVDLAQHGSRDAEFTQLLNQELRRAFDLSSGVVRT